jgi:hypothetical protein
MQSNAMDSCLEKLRENLESVVEGMSSEQLNWHPAGKWCAVEVLEHLYLSYTGTIHGFERVMSKGKPLATRASMEHCLLTLVIVTLGHMPAGRKAPAVALPKGLPAEQVRNEIGAKIEAMDAIIGQCEALRVPGPIARPSDSGTFECRAVEKAPCGAWATSPETASPASHKHDEANGTSLRANPMMRLAVRS